LALLLFFEVSMNTVQVNDIELAYVDRGPGPVVLLVHGFPLDHSMWDAQIEALSKEYRVIAPDLRGYGESALGEVDDAVGVPLERYADDLAGLLDALKIAEPVVFVGFSMGGYIGWQFWRRHRDRVRALVMCDTRAVADNDEGRAMRLKMAAHVAEWGAAKVADAMEPKLFAEVTRSQRPDLVAATRRVITDTNVRAIAAAQLGMAARVDSTLLLADINVPTLILVGEHDVLSTRDEMSGLADKIPNAKFVEIAGAGHMAPVEDPAAVTVTLLSFLSGLKK
jgi:3-oxoadipate enol-lactonase